MTKQEKITHMFRISYRSVYERSCVGCCCHVVLDDQNIEDHFIDFCCDQAIEAGHVVCLACLLILKMIPEEQREQEIYNASDQRREEQK